MSALSIDLHNLRGCVVTAGLADRRIVTGTIYDSTRTAVIMTGARIDNGPELTKVYVQPKAILWLHNGSGGTNE